MIIQLYLYDNFDNNALKILKLLDDNNLEFSLLTFDREESIEQISNLIGEKIRKLPQVVIDGKRIGGYYDIMEFLINKKLINYKGELNDIS